MVILLSSCTTSQTRPHPEGISSTNLNQGIQIIAPAAWNTFRLGDAISLQIINISTETLAFDKDFGIRIFIFKDDQWAETRNKLISVGFDNIIMKPPTNNKNETRGYSINPDIGEITSTALIRIYVFGKSSNKNELLGAFVDVYLNP